ncbi:hypothetical protein RAA17_11865 [Komagataeibacter rhaeticus]|nr:hypothetical protein [Komagataeibacter rhaeticus]
MCRQGLCAASCALGMGLIFSTSGMAQTQIEEDRARLGNSTR